MENTENNSIWSTRDLYLAATLVSLRFYLTGIDMQFEGDKNQPIGYFKFSETAALLEAKAKYTQGLLSVEPKQFVTNLKSLKSEIVNLQRNPHMAIK